MNHADNVAQIDSWLDNELNDDGQREVYAHLAFCRECREYIQIVKAMRQSAREDVAVFPSSLDEAVLAKVNAGTSNRNRLGWWREVRLSMPVAAAAALVVIGASLVAGHYWGAAHESSRWESEMRVGYQIPAVVVVGQVSTAEVSGSRTQ